MATDWGYKGSKLGVDSDSNDLDNWGICCVYAMSTNFYEEHSGTGKTSGSCSRTFCKIRLHTSIQCSNDLC